MGKIAVIDSGIGGLTVAKELLTQLPHEEIVYFGDQKNCPYGDKTKQQIQQYVKNIVDFLKTGDIKALVIACNTATSVVLPQLYAAYDFPILGVIEPGARYALQVSQSKKIGVIGTKKTIETGAYQYTIQGFDQEATVYSMACSKLVPFIESPQNNAENLQIALEEYLFPLTSQGVDTLILGCTHYPLIAKQIQKIVGEDVTLANPAYQTVVELKRTLAEHDLLASSPQKGEHLFYTSGDTHQFNQQIQQILGLKVQSIKEEAIFHVSKML